jgi:XTP/dITP diphosphohydrolase
MIKRLLVATRNAGKLRELAAALEPLDIEVVDLETLEDPTDVEETGSTFEENARLKAEEYSRRTDLPVLADDSGLEVDALDRAPGVHSARYGGPGLNDQDRNQKLLEALQEVPTDRRTARFRCTLALASAGKTLATFEGTIEGRILEAPSGENGFGYDPVFFHPPSGCTTAELTLADKQRVSHRGQAIAAFLEALKRGDSRLALSG